MFVSLLQTYLSSPQSAPMTQTFSSPVVVCRPALPRDTADVLEFIKFIWNGHDYVKYVWDEWFNDPDGILVAAEYEGHCVGIAKFPSPRRDSGGCKVFALIQTIRV